MGKDVIDFNHDDTSAANTGQALVVIDVALALLTYFVVFELRFDFHVPSHYWDNFELFLPVAVGVQVLATWAFGCYGRSWRHASIDEARRLLSAGLTTMVVLTAAFSWGRERVPFTVLIGGPIVVTFLYGLVRFQSRLFAFRRFGDPDDAGVRIVVVGAGGSGSFVSADGLTFTNHHVGADCIQKLSKAGTAAMPAANAIQRCRWTRS